MGKGVVRKVEFFKDKQREEEGEGNRVRKRGNEGGEGRRRSPVCRVFM